jgi:hypothetical protein
MTIFCMGTERDLLDTKEMVPRWGPERADCMLSEGRSGEKLYVCLCPPWKNPGDLHCTFIVTWFSKQNSQVFPAASFSCYPCPTHKYHFSPILTPPEMQLAFFRAPPGHHFLESNCLVPLETIGTHPQAPLQLLSGLDWLVSGQMFHMHFTQLAACFRSFLAWLTLWP